MTHDLTYYDRPLVKEPVWVWSVPSYFYVGGAAGASLALAAATQITDGSCRELITRCRGIGLGGTIIGSGFLIYDLGRPSRFFNMLRVFRPTSPMNIGSWILAATGSLAGAALLPRSVAPRAVSNAAAVGAGILGIPLSGYTGVLLANTTIPVWNAASRTLPGLFIASGMASAGALLHFTELPPREEAVARRFAIVGQAAELAAMIALERQVSAVERVGRPLKQGFSGFLWNAARILGAASLALSLVSTKSRRAKVAAGICGTAGALSLRFSLLQAGRNSARDPHAAFQQQRPKELAAASETSRIPAA
jgi:formate-dependent nitrite reductase membrane component NrfD